MLDLFFSDDVEKKGKGAIRCGERKPFALQAVLQPITVLLMDEIPTNHLDINQKCSKSGIKKFEDLVACPR
jgi:ATPase subunit of ABC transporter with duplicated ATPase domains